MQAPAERKPRQHTRQHRLPRCLYTTPSVSKIRLDTNEILTVRNLDCVGGRCRSHSSRADPVEAAEHQRVSFSCSQRRERGKLAAGSHLRQRPVTCERHITWQTHKKLSRLSRIVPKDDLRRTRAEKQWSDPLGWKQENDPLLFQQQLWTALRIASPVKLENAHGPWLRRYLPTLASSA